MVKQFLIIAEKAIQIVRNSIIFKATTHKYNKCIINSQVVKRKHELLRHELVSEVWHEKVHICTIKNEASLRFVKLTKR